MNTLLIIDLETTGLDPETDLPIELGAILYSISDRCTIQQISTLFPVVENSAENINHISAKASQTVKNTELVMNLFQEWVNMFYYLVAHNVEFDRKWFDKGILLFDRIPNLLDLVDQAVKRSIEPKISVIADVSYDDRQQAKERGFRWNWDNKKWVKNIRISEYEQEKSEYPFSVILD